MLKSLKIGQFIFASSLSHLSLSSLANADVEPLRNIAFETFHEKCLHVQGNSISEWSLNNQAWWTWDCEADKEFQFSLIPVRGNYYQIKSYYGKCLHVQGNGPQDWNKNAQPVLTWTCQDTDEFLFTFVAAGSSYYKIQTYHNKCLHVRGNTVLDFEKNMQPVLTWSCQDTDEFFFKILQY